MRWEGEERERGGRIGGPNEEFVNFFSSLSLSLFSFLFLFFLLLFSLLSFFSFSFFFFSFYTKNRDETILQLQYA